MTRSKNKFMIGVNDLIAEIKDNGYICLTYQIVDNPLQIQLLVQTPIPLKSGM